MTETTMTAQRPMHQGFMVLEQILPLVQMKRTSWYAKMKQGLVPQGQPHPFVNKQRIYTLEEIQALLHSMEAKRKVVAKGEGSAA